MTTTALFVEILVVGIQAMVWCILLVLAVTGYGWVDDIRKSLDGWETAASVVALTFAYPLGVIVDRVADLVFYLIPPQDFVMKWERIRKDVDEAPPDDRIRILLSTGKAWEFLEFIRARIRITRTTTLNCALITVAAIAFLESQGFSMTAVALAAIVGMIATGASWFAHGILEVTYTKRIRHILALLNPPDGTPGSAEPTQESDL